ncbi:hypothetical protein NC651_000650 [Populus alba x Populus x berolinensis]|nr:hypothetical protein NC651_000650 [Populus alba x Populus x berolinensis]
MPQMRHYLSWDRLLSPCLLYNVPLPSSFFGAVKRSALIVAADMSNFENEDAFCDPFWASCLDLQEGAKTQNATVLFLRKPGTVSDKGEQGQEIDYVTKNCDSAPPIASSTDPVFLCLRPLQHMYKPSFGPSQVASRPNSLKCNPVQQIDMRTRRPWL